MVGVYDYKIATRYTALNDYIPIAPTDDEAKNHNENLPLKSTLEQISICERGGFPCGCAHITIMRCFEFS